MHLKPNYSPKQIISFINSQIGWMKFTSAVLILIGLFFSFLASPTDYQQGETVRIMYVHVPCSWGGMAVYFIMAVVVGYGFIKQIPLSFIIVKAMAPTGLCLCLISLITGSIWGKPTWGTWWVWDARLTSMLILALFYLAYLFLTYSSSFINDRIAGIIIIIGSINLPIIKWSVEWWNTLHQPASIMRLAKPAIHWQMLIPLFIMALAFACTAITLFLINLRSELNYRRLLAQQLKRSTNATV